MGLTSAMFGSKLLISGGKILETAYLVRFKRTTLVSDHFCRSISEKDKSLTRVNMFDGTFLAFIDPKKIEIFNYSQKGTIKGSIHKFEYVNELHWGPDDQFCIYFLILPKEYYPEKYIVPSKPHFAARIGDKIRITWWFKEKTEIKLTIKHDKNKYNKFEFIDSPSFIEKQPLIKSAIDFTERLAAETLGKLLDK